MMSRTSILMSRTALHRSHEYGGRGFTLIEIMIAVAIVAILSAVAVPSYRDYVLRSALVDGLAGLSTMAVAMEQHYQDNRTFKTVGKNQSPCGWPSEQRTYGRFSAKCSTYKDQEFVITATGSGLAKNFTFQIDQDGNRATTRVPSGWTMCPGKWVTKKGETC